MLNRFERQSFLGDDAQEIFNQVCVGIVGLGGGGSHIVQQLAHLGFGRYRLFDLDTVTGTNLNRNVGSTLSDVEAQRKKVTIAERMIRNLLPEAEIFAFGSRWQDVKEKLIPCDVIFGCVDTFSEREQLEAFARRYLISYIDIGLDIHKVGNEPPRMAGQVILSMPGHHCMWCMGFLDNHKLDREAAMYGATGGRPQVIWPNAILASAAVGVCVELFTNWSGGLSKTVYRSLDANTLSLVEHPRLEYVLREPECRHYPLENVGPVEFRWLRKEVK